MVLVVLQWSELLNLCARVVCTRVGVYCDWDLTQISMRISVGYPAVPCLEKVVLAERKFSGLARWPQELRRS